MPRRIMFSRPVASAFKPTEVVSNAVTRPDEWMSAGGRLVNSSKNFEEGRLPSSVWADDSEAIAMFDIQIKIAQSHDIDAIHGVLFKRAERGIGEDGFFQRSIASLIKWKFDS